MKEFSNKRGRNPWSLSAKSEKGNLGKILFVVESLGGVKYVQPHKDTRSLEILEKK